MLWVAWLVKTNYFMILTANQQNNFRRVCEEKITNTGTYEKKFKNISDSLINYPAASFGELDPVKDYKITADDSISLNCNLGDLRSFRRRANQKDKILSADYGSINRSRLAGCKSITVKNQLKKSVGTLLKLLLGVNKQIPLLEYKSKICQ